MQSIKNLNILITGGAGFIGYHLCRFFLSNNCNVIAIDNLSTGSINNINDLKKEYSNFNFIEGDICDTKLVSDLTKKADYIFHLAALGSVNRSIEDPLSTHLANATGFLNMLHHAKLNSVKGFVYASSSSVYGDDTTLPKIETKIGKPLSPYAVTKLTNELYAQIYHQLYTFPIIGLRFFNVFGPKQNPNGPYAAAIPIFINAMLKNEPVKIFGTGEQKRDFTYVENIVHACYCSLISIINNNKQAFGNVFNIGCNQSVSINEVFRLLATNLNYSQKPIYADTRKGDVFQSLASIEKSKNILNYTPKVFFEEGLNKTLKFYQSLRS